MEDLLPASPTSSALLLLSLGPAWLLSLVLYRLWLHPLARFPGPKLAAITTWYEGYYDIKYGGRYLWEIEKMHHKYGTIVRVGPNEVHINDPSFYETIYNGRQRLDKFDYYYRPLTFPLASFGTLDANLHRLRRSALNPFFSVQAVLKIQPLLQQLVNRLCERMQAQIDKDEPIPLFYAYRCITVDLITEYAFGERYDMLERADWGRSFYRAWRNVWDISPVMRQFPFLLGVFMGMPRWMTKMIDKRMLEILDLNSGIDESTARTIKLPEDFVKEKNHPTVVWQLNQTDQLPPEERSFKRISLEANTIVSGGFETTATALTYTTFQILNSREIHARLLAELKEAIPDATQMPGYQRLQELPYLTACIKEGLRLSFGAIGRLPRSSRTECIPYKNHLIPPNTGIGMSPYFLHLNASTFPAPHDYNPSRWLPSDPTSHTPGDTRSPLDKHLLNFSRGPRSCVGINLAYAELYTLIGTLVRRFEGLRLWETGVRDVEIWHDYFAGMGRHEGEGLQVKG